NSLRLTGFRPVAFLEEDFSVFCRFTLRKSRIKTYREQASGALRACTPLLTAAAEWSLIHRYTLLTRFSRAFAYGGVMLQPSAAAVPFRRRSTLSCLHFLCVAIFCVTTILVAAQSAAPKAQINDPALDARIDAVLHRMTLEEKV